MSYHDADVLSYIDENGEYLCVDCVETADIDTDDEESCKPVFAGSEGAFDFVCVGCGFSENTFNQLNPTEDNSNEVCDS